MDKMNKLLNICIFIIISCLIIFCGYLSIEPLLYNNNMKIKSNTSDDYTSVYTAINKYLIAYQINDYKAINTMLNIYRKSDDSTYAKVSDEVIKSYNRLFIYAIAKKRNGVYAVEYCYTLDSRKIFGEVHKEKIVIKLNREDSTFKIYFDSLLDKY